MTAPSYLRSRSGLTLVVPRGRARRQLATRTDRIAARMADLLLVLALLVPAAAAELFSARGAVVYLVDVALIVAVVYLLVSDGVPNCNVGKRLGGLGVVDAHTGQACTVRQSFIRNVMLLLGPLDWIFMAGHRRQRIGDHLAGTEVITLERE